MSVKFDIHHVTSCHYAAPMRFARCNLRLEPIEWDGQRVISHGVRVDPDGLLKPAPARGSLSNLSRLVVSSTTRSLTITSDAKVEIDRAVPLILESDLTIAEVSSLARKSNDVSDQSPANFLYASPRIPADPAIAAWAFERLNADQPALSSALDLAKHIAREFRFDPDATKTETSAREAFDARAGVCQDFAQIMICALRSVGLPAAYVSGYIRTIPPPGQVKLQGADAMHGWVLLWCGPKDAPGGRGWIGLDPTNSILMAGDHIIVAIGRDYKDIAPIEGIFTGSGAQDVKVAVDVVPAADD